MRAAILISGYMRSLELNIQSLYDKILSKFEKIDIFLHITNNETNEDRYLNNIKRQDIDKIKSILKPVVIVEENNLNLSECSKENNVYNTWLKYYKLNKLKIEYEKKNGKYDIVIKYRPDMNILSDLETEIIKDVIYIPSDSKIDTNKLLFQDDPYICDIFAYGNTEIMNKYFEIVTEIDKLFVNYGSVPETVLYYYLKINKIKHKLIDIDYAIILSKCNIFAICGDSGSGKTTLGNLLKNYFSNSFMFECDRYHKWERGNENWKIYSHLNPDANYLTKMNKDIFDLKIGKNIFQVNYDHKTGKFTDKEKIVSTDNIIVCGLHSLYSDNDAIYDLKIFMDTDINLKYSWKIKRDMKERGYSLEKIINQIKYREADFKKYIYPQREKSDIIVNFTTDVEFSLSNISKDLPVYLNIYLNKKINIENIINFFAQNSIKFLFEENKEFNKISFFEYKKSELIELHTLNNFYDYLIFIILNIQKK